MHNDAIYGHQEGEARLSRRFWAVLGPKSTEFRPFWSVFGPGEVNFWMPLTCQRSTRTTLWVEAEEEFRPLDVGVGQVVPRSEEASAELRSTSL